MKKIWVFMICGLILAALSSCKKQEPAADGSKSGDAVTRPAPKTGKLTIAVIPKGTTHVFWKSIHAGAIKAARELEVEIIWKGGLKESDRDAQIKVMEDMINRQVDGIVLAPLDDVALKPVVHDAIRNDIPVVIIDSELKTDKYVSFVATDNYKGGVKAGMQMGKLLNGKGKIVMLRFMEGSASTMNREKGFLDALKEHAPEVEVLSDNQYGGATTDESYTASENLLARFRTPQGELTIDGIFCPNESTCFGMLRCLQDMKLAGKVTYVGFDSSEMLVKAMKNNELHALVLQDPINMGYLGVKALVTYLRGDDVEKRIDTGSEVATPQNMNEARMKDLMDPDFNKWLNLE